MLCNSFIRCILYSIRPALRRVLRPAVPSVCIFRPALRSQNLQSFLKNTQKTARFSYFVAEPDTLRHMKVDIFYL